MTPLFPSQLPSRRQFLTGTACGFGALACTALAAQEHRTGSSATHSPAPTRGMPHFAPRARRVIFLFMQGGVSQVDSFDPKPRLTADDGRMMPFDDSRKRANTGNGQSEQRIMKSPWKFERYGQCGRAVSELFPHIGKRVDDLCFLHGLHTEGVAHGPATLFLHCGATTAVRPSVGSWVLYGLGTGNASLPGFVSIGPSAGNGGARNYGPAFLPAEFQGTPLGQA
ncbi:MAG: DUF1501 domain-containing protein, partial [Planctomycetaceae bacterium]